MPSTTRVKYKWIYGAENLEAYEPGGYHPVTTDQVIHNRYRIINKLGYGGYSTIWLAHDQERQQNVALKIGISRFDSVRREIATLRALEKRPCSLKWDPAWMKCAVLPRVLDAFDVTGPNGVHACYTLAPMQGDLQEALFSGMFHIPVARALAAKLMLAVSFLHAHGVCHGDIHLQNLLVERTEPIDHLSVEEYWETFGEPETEPVEREDGKPLTSNVPPVATLAWSSEKEATEFTLEDAKRLVISDFGEAFDPSSKTRLGKDSHVPLAKRAPEAFFEPDQPLSYASDVWSLGTAIWGIIGMKNLFSDDEPPNSTVAQQIDLLGADHLPPTWKSIWQRPQSEILAEDRRPHPPEWKREPWPPLDTAFEKFVQKYRREEGYVPFEADETAAILALMRGMLRFDPKERLTIEEALQSEWMVKWALPELQKAMQTDCGQSHE